MRLHKLISLGEARRIIDSLSFHTPSSISIPAYMSSWRISAVTIRAHRSIPSVPVAAMDGYAVRVSDLGTRSFLRIVGEVKPGDSPPVLGGGEAYYIHMGAPMPVGSDAVARVEACRVESGYVRPLEPLRPGKDVIDVGEVIREGSIVVERGEVIKPYKVALLLMLGILEAQVYDINVGVLSVGDEIGRFDHPTGKPIIDSISPMIIGLLKYVNPVYLGVVSDSIDDIARVIEESIRGLDAILTIGGASAGETDNVKKALTRIGDIVFPGVSASILKRGSIALINGKPVVTLPAQCVSAALVFHEHFLHILSRMVGRELREYMKAKLAVDINVKHRMDTAYIFKVRDGEAHPLRWGTGLCADLAEADGFTVLERGLHRAGEDIILQLLIR